MLEVVKNAVVKCEKHFSCHDESIVTDNAANRAKMRRVVKDNGLNVVSYKCSAQLLNLQARDIEVTGIKDNMYKLSGIYETIIYPPLGTSKQVEMRLFSDKMCDGKALTKLACHASDM